MRMFCKKFERNCSKRGDGRNDEEGLGALKRN